MTLASPPCTIVIFGAAGDLTQRLLMPSIYNLASGGLLDPKTKIVGADHNDRDDASWRDELKKALEHFALAKDSESQTQVDEKAWSFVSDRLAYVKFDFESDAAYDPPAKDVSSETTALFYLAVSPRFFETIARGLGRAGLLKEGGSTFRRIVVEKPFGRDVPSAKALNDALLSLAAESQTYRIDHFLGKEAVQGIPALRFGTRILEPILNRENVASVQITAAETVGVEERGAFYENTGALRDMVPNHLFSLLTMVAMDPPKSFDAEDVRDAKAALLASLRPLTGQDAARGQYGSGTLNGESVRAYRDEDKVAKDSRTETYAALCAYVDNERWRGVPFYIRTGKRMNAHVTTIALVLRPVTGLLDVNATLPHVIAFGVDPQRGVVERFAAKQPGVDLTLGRAHMGFQYDQLFKEPPNIGYETLLYDAMRGHTMLFQRNDMIDYEWTAVQGVLDAWAADTTAPELYAPSSAGPSSADTLLARNGDHW